MTFKKIAVAIGASALIATPVIAQSANKGDFQRIGAKTADAEKLGGENGILFAILAVSSVIGGLILATSKDDVDLPVSP